MQERVWWIIRRSVVVGQENWHIHRCEELAHTRQIICRLPRCPNAGSWLDLLRGSVAAIADSRLEANLDVIIVPAAECHKNVIGNTRDTGSYDLRAWLMSTAMESPSWLRARRACSSSAMDGGDEEASDEIEHTGILVKLGCIRRRQAAAAAARGGTSRELVGAVCVCMCMHAGRRSRRGGQRVAKSAACLGALVVGGGQQQQQRDRQRSLRRRVCAATKLYWKWLEK